MLTLVGLLVEVIRRLKQPVAMMSARSLNSLSSLGASGLKRHPLRTTLAVGLISVATLLILSMSLFEAAPDERGTGGFQLMAQSSSPIAKNLADPAYQREILGAEQASLLARATIIPFRVRQGDDAGCNNLYQASEPRVLGVSERMAEWINAMPENAETFAWAVMADGMDAHDRARPWRLLEKPGDGSSEKPFPVMIDQNTAMWGLHLTGGVGQRFSYQFAGQEIFFETVAQTTEHDFARESDSEREKFFAKPSRRSADIDRGYFMFRPTRTLARSRDGLKADGERGMDVVESRRVLENLLAVQNTYLRAFQSLGALGLLLGTFGVAVVQLRSVMERQSEFGLLRAIGFTRGGLAN